MSDLMGGIVGDDADRMYAEMTDRHQGVL